MSLKIFLKLFVKKLKKIIKILLLILVNLVRLNLYWNVFVYCFIIILFTFPLRFAEHVLINGSMFILENSKLFNFITYLLWLFGFPESSVFEQFSLVITIDDEFSPITITNEDFFDCLLAYHDANCCYFEDEEDFFNILATNFNLAATLEFGDPCPLFGIYNITLFDFDTTTSTVEQTFKKFKADFSLFRFVKIY